MTTTEIVLIIYWSGYICAMIFGLFLTKKELLEDYSRGMVIMWICYLIGTSFFSWALVAIDIADLIRITRYKRKVKELNELK